MVKARWGLKLTCHKCGAKYYNLKKKRSICPQCNTEYKEENIKPRRGSAKETPKPAPETPNQSDSEEALINAELDEEIPDSEDDKTKDNTIIEDTSDIGRDEEDIEEVIGVVDDSGEKE